MNPLRENLPVAMAASGVILILLGIVTLPYIGLYFSPQSATLVLLGGAALTLSFLVNSQVSRESPNALKIYVLLMCTAIMLVAIAIVAYMIVNVHYLYYNMGITIGPYSEGSRIAVVPVIDHIYGSYAGILVLTAVALALNAQYIKSRML